jgi:hypothetical protein
MLYLIRHSERLSYVDSEKWKKHPRYKINNKDDPLTKNGKVIATTTITNMCNSGKLIAKNMEYIYSSPFSRCIETSLIFQKIIKQLLSINVLIRIEYALVEISINTNFYIKDNVISVDNTVGYLDDKLELENIYQKYGSSHFDIEYKPFVQFRKVNFDKTFEDGYNRAYSVFETFKKNTTSSKINILCTHGTFMNSIYSISVNTVNMWNINYTDYCVVLGYKNNVKKPILGPVILT